MLFFVASHDVDIPAGVRAVGDRNEYIASTASEQDARL